ncbi:hypothetical protein chiPu_0027961 [Chiloscyllium punctatum]|uniref:Ig-like domain-containing protein n=1 Tax=Chiloscyllium punctatum TaxID=137246 RepID=A0A401TLU8_CHIPU|nr:hypothetical protein [Chiloscyllium punctatum]
MAALQPLHVSTPTAPVIPTGALSIRVVQVPRGPLYRVEGTHVFIPCNVTQDEGTDRLVFRWDFVKAGTETGTPIAVVSTQDSGYPDARYQPRVRAGEIYIHRLSRSSAQLHLTHLQRGDQGQYECKVGSKAQLTSQSAKVELKGWH